MGVTRRLKAIDFNFTYVNMEKIEWELAELFHTLTPARIESVSYSENPCIFTGTQASFISDDVHLRTWNFLFNYWFSETGAREREEK